MRCLWSVNPKIDPQPHAVLHAGLWPVACLRAAELTLGRYLSQKSLVALQSTDCVL